MLRTALYVLLLAAFSHAQLPDATNQKQHLLWQKLESTVRDTDRGLDGVMGVAILDLTSGEILLLHADEVFPQASSIKIAVLAELYRQHQQGKLRLSDTYAVDPADLVADSWIMGGLTPGTRVTMRDLATMIISVSDNSATNVLIDRLGMENVNALLQSLGLKNTRLRRKMMDLKAASEGRENVSTPREMMTLLEAAYRGKLFNKQLTDDFLKILATGKNSPIREVVPEDTMSADKPGELEGVRTDSGIVFATNRPFVICVMTTYLRDEKAANAAISKIADAAFSYFDRLGRASPLGRVISPRNSGPPR